MRVLFVCALLFAVAAAGTVDIRDVPALAFFMDHPTWTNPDQTQILCDNGCEGGPVSITCQNEGIVENGYPSWRCTDYEDVRRFKDHRIDCDHADEMHIVRGSCWITITVVRALSDSSASNGLPTPDDAFSAFSFMLTAFVCSIAALAIPLCCMIRNRQRLQVYHTPKEDLADVCLLDSKPSEVVKQPV